MQEYNSQLQAVSTDDLKQQTKVIIARYSTRYQKQEKFSSSIE